MTACERMHFADFEPAGESFRTIVPGDTQADEIPPADQDVEEFLSSYCRLPPGSNEPRRSTLVRELRSR